MKLHLNHIGEMALKVVPLVQLLDGPPRIKSVMIKPNQYMKVEIDPWGGLHVNDMFAGFFEEPNTSAPWYKESQPPKWEHYSTIEYVKLYNPKGGR